MPPSQTGPVKYLQDLYVVVLGVAVVLAAEEIIAAESEGIPVEWSVLPLFVAFGLIAFPTYHGIGAYLDLTYGAGGTQVRPLRVIADFVVGFLQFFLLIALALLISRPVYFAGTMMLLVFSDAVRTVALRRFAPREDMSSLESNSAVINGSAGLAVGVVLAVVWFAGWDEGQAETLIKVAVPLIALVRTTVAYVKNYDLLIRGHG